MSILRLIFFLIIAFFIITLYILFKKKKLKNRDFIIYLIILSIIFIINLFPNFLWFFLAKKEYIRLIFLLIISIIIIFCLLIYFSKRILELENNFNKLVSNLALREFQDKYNNISGLYKNILIIIPAYNEANNLKVLLPKIPKKIYGFNVKILICVDGATDETEQIGKELNIPVVVHSINLGGGAALKLGYKIALELEAPIVVTIDADGQHNPLEIENLVKPIIEEDYDFVSASRVLGTQEEIVPIRQAGIAFFNKLISFLLNRKITDCSNAFRAFKTEILSNITLTQKQFHTTELLIEVLSKNYKFKEVPVNVLKRISGVTKKPSSLKYGWGFFKAILLTFIRN